MVQKGCPFGQPFYTLQTTSALSATSKLYFEQLAASFLVCSLIFIKYKTNKNHNKLIHKWLPKETKKTTSKEVVFIKNWINNYHKKCLNYKSPRDFFVAN